MTEGPFDGSHESMRRCTPTSSILSRRSHQAPPTHRALPLLGLLFALLVTPLAALAAPAGPPRPFRADFELFTIEDKLFSLERTRQAKGVELIAVDFFDLTCAPCKKAMPEWKRLQERYAERGLRVVVVALRGDQNAREELAALREYMAKLRAPFAVVFDKYAKVAKQYGVTKDGAANIPQAFVVDRDGKLLRHAQGPHKPVFEAIRERLKEGSTAKPPLKVIGR